MTARLETATLAALVLLSLAIYVVYSRLNRFSVKRIRGPDAPLWLGECNFSQPITRSLMSRDCSTVPLYQEMFATSIDKPMSETWTSSMREIMD